jgi:hypothetical protein
MNETVIAIKNTTPGLLDRNTAKGLSPFTCIANNVIISDDSARYVLISRGKLFREFESKMRASGLITLTITGLDTKYAVVLMQNFHNDDVDLGDYKEAAGGSVCEGLDV